MGKAKSGKWKFRHLTHNGNNIPSNQFFLIEVSYRGITKKFSDLNGNGERYLMKNR